MSKRTYKNQSVEQVKQINNKLSDKDIIEKVLLGEKHLFELIMRRYNQRLFRIGRTYIKNEDEVEDILQETYIKAYENLGKFESRSNFSTWLIRILINLCLSKIAYSKRYENTDFQSNQDEDMHSIKKIEDKKMKTPEQNTINNELSKHLEKSIDKLPDKYRSVFMMREIEKMSVAETSESLNITESNVKVRLNRAKEILREDLTRIYDNIEVFQFLGARCDRIVENVMKKLNII